MIYGEMTRSEAEELVRPIPGDFVVYLLTGRVMKILYFSESILSSFDVSESDFCAATARDALDVVMPADRAYVLASVLGRPAGPAEIHCVFRLMHRERGFFWVHSKSRIIGTLDGRPLILTNYLNASAESESYSSILDDTDVAFYTVDRNTHEILYANRAARKQSVLLSGGVYARHPCYEYLFARSTPCPDCPMGILAPDEVMRDERIDSRDGRWRAIARKRVLWCGHDCMEVFSEDITDKKLREAASLASAKRYELAVRGARLAVWEYDVRTRRMTLPEGEDGRRAAVHYGLTSSVIENVPDSLLPLGASDADRDNFKNMYAEIAAGREYVTGEFRFVLPGAASPCCERVTYYVQKGLDGEPSVAYGVGQDITAERQERDRYRSSLHELISSNPKALCSYRLNLTRNSCSEEHGTSDYIRRLLRADTADTLLENIAATAADEEDRAKFRARFSRAELAAAFARGETARSLDYRRLLEDGDSHWVSTAVSMLRNPGTSDIEAFIYSLDISDAVREEAIIRCVVREEFDSIAIINVRRGTIAFRNLPESSVPTTPHAFENYDEDIRYAFKLVDPEDWEADIEAISLGRVLRELESTPIYTYAFTMRDGSGRALRKLLKYCYVDETRQEVLLSRNDITGEFERQNEQLRATEAAMRAADTANRMKTRFLSNVSHDMRTPLNAVLGYASLALAESDVGRKDGYLAKIREAGGTLLSLINDTLDLQKIETGVTALRPVPVRREDILHGIVTAVKPMMDAGGIDFHADISGAGQSPVMADPMRLQEIFINLLSNAAKFTPRGGRVDFIVSREGPESGVRHDVAVVRDSGIGISPGFLPKIFEPFTQERTEASAGIGGTGLGLSIVKGLVELMGGEITVKSELGRGTEFTVRLPFVCAESDPGGAPAEGRSARLDGRTILLCEDNAMNTEIARRMLESRGCRVVCAANGLIGSERFIRSSPGEYDAILMDIRMPVMDGVEAAARIRASLHPAAGIVPIVAMSADAYEDDVRRCLDAGMNGHVAKPVDPDELFRVLSELL